MIYTNPHAVTQVASASYTDGTTPSKYVYAGNRLVATINATNALSVHLNHPGKRQNA
jgi:hypothetical protein